APSVSGLGNSREMSRPTSATAGMSWSAACEPAERTRTRPCARWSRSTAAICERPALWTQTNSASGMADIAESFVDRNRSVPAAQPQRYVHERHQHGHLDQRADD